MTSLVSDRPVYIWFTASCLWSQRGGWKWGIREKRHQCFPCWKWWLPLTLLCCMHRHVYSVLLLCVIYLFSIMFGFFVKVPEAANCGALLSCQFRLQWIPKQRKVSHNGIWRRRPPTDNIYPACRCGLQLGQVDQKLPQQGNRLRGVALMASQLNTTPLKEAPLSHIDFHSHCRQEQWKVWSLAKKSH